MKVILGSASPRRQKLLKDWGYDFDVRIPKIDEKAIRVEDIRRLPLHIAKAKAEHLYQQISEPAILITCDTIVVHDGKVYEKPVDETQAREFLQAYGHKPAEVISGVVVTDTATGKAVGDLESAKVYFHKIPHKHIEDMIKLGKIFDFSGAFHIADPAIKPYIALIEGEIELVLGLPKFLTEKLMKEVLL